MPSQSDPLQLIGLQIAERYRVVRMVGIGGSSVVYEANHELTERRVALKVLLPNLAEEDSHRRRFLREARAAAALEHPNVVEVLDMGTFGASGVYLATEFLEGHTLGRLIRRKGRLDPIDIEELLLPIMDAVRAAHALGLIHRDLKPANIFISTKKGTQVPKLLDFGLAKEIIQPTPSVSSSGLVLGTPRYMSPEQLGGTADLDPATDVWSMGVVLYFALTGIAPFDDDNVVALAEQIREGDYEPIESVRRDLPASLSAAIGQALMVDRSERPPEMGALMELVRTGVAPASDPPPSIDFPDVTTVPPASAQPRPAIWIAAAVILVVGIIAGAAFVVGGKAARVDGPPAQPEATAAIDEPEVPPAPPPALPKKPRVQPSPKAAALFREAVQYAKADRHQAALLRLDEALELTPDFAEALHRRALIKEDLGQAKRALADFEAAYGLAPDDAQLLNNYSHALTESGQIDRAQALIDEAVRLAPDVVLYSENRAALLIRRKQYAEAASQLQALTARVPKRFDLQITLGIAQRKSGQPAAAYATLAKVLWVQPESERALLQFAKAASEARTPKRALGFVTRHLEKHPTCIPMRYFHARLLAESGDPAARQALEGYLGAKDESAERRAHAKAWLEKLQ